MFASKIRVLVTTFFLSAFTFATVSAQYAGGTGTELDPYQVSTADHLNNVRNNLTSYFIQTADIDLSSYAEWTPIGTTFTGSYNGNGYTISNLTLGSGNDIDLFSQLGSGGVLKNIVVSDATLTNSTRHGQNIAILVGYTEGTITDCIISGQMSITGYHSDYRRPSLICQAQTTVPADPKSPAAKTGTCTAPRSSPLPLPLLRMIYGRKASPEPTTTPEPQPCYLG